MPHITTSALKGSIMFRRSLFAPALLLAASLALAAPAHAADPTIEQIYTEARGGDVDGALVKMNQVLKDHPNSAKAHYVEAELLAHAHRLGDARGELAKAESLDPGLNGISAHSVGELKAELNGTRAGTLVPAPITQQSHMPWGMITILGIIVFGFLAVMRRRAPANYGPGMAPGMGAGMTGTAMPPQSGMMGGGMMGPGYGPGYGGGMMGGGMMGGGGGLLGGLARGAAMGAGFAAGERVIDDVFGGGHGAAGGVGQGVDPNPDMGGNDFGVSDAGSWDGGGGDFGGGGGGDGGW